MQQTLFLQFQRKCSLKKKKENGQCLFPTASWSLNFDWVAVRQTFLSRVSVLSGYCISFVLALCRNGQFLSYRFFFFSLSLSLSSSSTSSLFCLSALTSILGGLEEEMVGLLTPCFWLTPLQGFVRGRDRCALAKKEKVLKEKKNLLLLILCWLEKKKSVIQPSGLFCSCWCGCCYSPPCTSEMLMFPVWSLQTNASTGNTCSQIGTVHKVGTSVHWW